MFFPDRLEAREKKMKEGKGKAYSALNSQLTNQMQKELDLPY